MTRLEKALGMALVAALVAILIAWWRTSPPPAPRTRNTPQALSASDYVDQITLDTARRLAQLAAGPDQQTFAEAAVRLADHELALAFAAALRDLEAHPPVLSDAARAIEARRQQSLSLLDADQQRVAELTAALKNATPKQRDPLQDQLNLAESQQDLDKDELAEADQDLTDAGGNREEKIQSMMQDHEAAMHARPTAATGPASTTAEVRGLVRKAGAWWALRAKSRRLQEAAEASDAAAATLRADRSSLAARLDADKGGIPMLAHHTREARTNHAAPPPGAPSQQSHADASALLDQTRKVVADQKILGLLDRRIADHGQLAGVYRQWNGAVTLQARATLHAQLLDAALIAALGLGLILLDGWLLRVLDRPKVDRRQLETLRSITRASLRVLAALVILLILFGVPADLGTLLGLMGAGLTVALKDFIVAFFGWLVLMGRNGMRLGDWVEINGVSGEVIDLGMFRTVLLETGNNDTSHPTGRRVTFTNSFAIEGHYFNFSTSGQWLWDELQLVVPSGLDPNPIVAAIAKQLTELTAAGAQEAEKEWQRAVPTQGGGSFTGKPSISIKPVLGGVEIGLRYITRANERSALRATLYESAVNLLGRHPGPSAAQSA